MQLLQRFILMLRARIKPGYKDTNGERSIPILVFVKAKDFTYFEKKEINNTINLILYYVNLKNN